MTKLTIKAVKAIAKANGISFKRSVEWNEFSYVDARLVGDARESARGFANTLEDAYDDIIALATWLKDGDASKVVTI